MDVLKYFLWRFSYLNVTDYCDHNNYGIAQHSECKGLDFKRWPFNLNNSNSLNFCSRLQSRAFHESNKTGMSVLHPIRRGQPSIVCVQSVTFFVHGAPLLSKNIFLQRGNDTHRCPHWHAPSLCSTWLALFQEVYFIFDSTTHTAFRCKKHITERVKPTSEKVPHQTRCVFKVRRN